MIVANRLTKVFGHVRAVNEVSFELKTGRITGFLGPNGAGKSTTIRMLTCYLPPTSGSATVAGHDVFSDSLAVRQKLGYLPENVPMYPEMRVTEYLAFRAKLRGLDSTTRAQRIPYVLERCWLKNVARRPIGHLSKGYRQRVGLADALLHNPPVLILDEPTVGLDPTQIRETRKLIHELRGEHTVLLSTHILPEVEQVCDDVVVIAGGRVVAQGTPEGLRSSRRLTARTLVEVRAKDSEAKSEIERIGGVRSVEVLGNSEGFARLAVRGGEKQDVREAVAKALSSKGWGIRELQLEKASLEEFFIEVTANQAVAQQEVSQ